MFRGVVFLVMDDLLARMFVWYVDACVWGFWSVGMLVCGDVGVYEIVRRVFCCLSVLADGYEKKNQESSENPPFLYS